jgi:hypothetical protein
MIVLKNSLPFSDMGFGSEYHSTFKKAFGNQHGQFPFTDRGHTLLSLGDFSGQSNGQVFETYSLLFLDPDKNMEWFSRQRQFRSSGIALRRRIAFKALNDRVRQRALVPFLKMANSIHGCLVTIAITKNSESIFEQDASNHEGEELLLAWKPRVREHVLRVANLSAYFLTAISRPGQNVYWLIDADAAVANDEQVRQITKVLSRLLGNYLPHDLGHIRCGCSRSDNGSLELEDLLAIPDLVAGATAELCSEFIKQNCFPRKGLHLPLPRNLSSKTLLIANWMSYLHSPLRRELFILEPFVGRPGSRLTHCKIGPLWQS